MNRYNVWNKWGKLKTVMLGQQYPVEFFRDIKNDKIRSALCRITEETYEDLEGYERVLKEFGCRVLRPQLDSNDSIMNYTDDEGRLSLVPRSPLQPRDTQIVLGNKLFFTGTDHMAIVKELLNYNIEDILMIQPTPLELQQWEVDVRNNQFANIRNYRYNEYLDSHDYTSDKYDYFGDILRRGIPYIDAPSMTLLGRDLYVDNRVDRPKYLDNWEETKALAIGLEIFESHPYIKTNFRVNEVNIGGHNDACFNVFKEGALLSLYDVQDYNKTFPNWDVLYLPKARANIGEFESNKWVMKGSWWTPDRDDNPELKHFVDTWLSKWVGYCQETVFDVNSLALDEHHLCVSQMNPEVNAFLKKHKVEPVYIPWRHRYFWDGGLHCITLELEREGEQEDYFVGCRRSAVSCQGF